MRKVAADLLEAVPKIGKIPIYINLKEWRASSEWTIEVPPTDRDLLDFVKERISAIDLFAAHFASLYFDRLLQDGRLFFSFDSFDEIPAVLDVSESSWLISRLSEVLIRFLSVSANAQGIIASRLYRRPRLEGINICQLQIRPFTDYQIKNALVVQFKRMVPDNVSNRIAIERSGS